jgi:mono/diheme cytochrome c family protein
MDRIIVVAACLFAFGCSKKDDTAQRTAAITPEARQVFADRCALCHGATGKGDAPAAAAMNPKPRDYTDATWQASVTDDYLKKVIIEGGAAVGKSPMMTPNSDLASKPEVVDGLVAIIRSFKK